MVKLNGLYSPTDSIKGFIPQRTCLGCEWFMPHDDYCIKFRINQKNGCNNHTSQIN